jgi:hypothetical protein
MSIHLLAPAQSGIAHPEFENPDLLPVGELFAVVLCAMDQGSSE